MAKKLTRKISVDFYTLNAKVLPAEKETTERYAGLIENWFKSGYKIVTRGDKRHYYSIRALETFADGKIYYAILTKYLSFDGIEFYNTATKKPIPHPIPHDVEGRINDYELIFIPEKHRFAVIKVGKINTGINRKGAPLNKMQEIIKIGFDGGLEVGEEAVVEIAQEPFIFEEILANDLLALTFSISYTNDDVLPEGRALMDNLMKNDHIGKFFGRIKPDNEGVIETKKGMTRGILELARENGNVKATIDTDEGQKTINTINYPAIRSAETGASKNRVAILLLKIYNKIMGIESDEEE